MSWSVMSYSTLCAASCHGSAGSNEHDPTQALGGQAGSAVGARFNQGYGRGERAGRQAKGFKDQTNKARQRELGSSQKCCADRLPSPPHPHSDTDGTITMLDIN